MPKKRPKLVALSEHIAVARRIIEELTATLEAEGVLRTYASSLMQAHERKMREEAKAKKGETLKKKKLPGDPSRRSTRRCPTYGRPGRHNYLYRNRTRFPPER
jgi:hypothetical protein